VTERRWIPLRGRCERFNGFYYRAAVGGATDALERAGATSKDVDVVRVPGAFELPLVSKKVAATGKYDALVAIGCVIRGETTHYDYVCARLHAACSSRSWTPAWPIIFCVLTCDTLEQAIDRAGLKGGNKGFEAGLAAIEMAHLSRKLRANPRSWPSFESRGASNVSLRRKSREFAMQMLFQWT